MQGQTIFELEDVFETSISWEMEMKKILMLMTSP